VGGGGGGGPAFSVPLPPLHLASAPPPSSLPCPSCPSRCPSASYPCPWGPSSEQPSLEPCPSLQAALCVCGVWCVWCTCKAAACKKAVAHFHDMVSNCLSRSNCLGMHSNWFSHSNCLGMHAFKLFQPFKVFGHAFKLVQPLKVFGHAFKLFQPFTLFIVSCIAVAHFACTKGCTWLGNYLSSISSHSHKPMDVKSNALSCIFDTHSHMCACALSSPVNTCEPTRACTCLFCCRTPHLPTMLKPCPQGPKNTSEDVSSRQRPK